MFVLNASAFCAMFVLVVSVFCALFVLVGGPLALSWWEVQRQIEHLQVVSFLRVAGPLFLQTGPYPSDHIY